MQFEIRSAYISNSIKFLKATLSIMTPINYLPFPPLSFRAVPLQNWKSILYLSVEIQTFLYTYLAS